MDIVRIVDVENSLGFVLPDAVVARLKLAAGDGVEPGLSLDTRRRPKG